MKLILIKENVYTVVHTWKNNFAPGIYIHAVSMFKSDQYALVKFDPKASYYKYVSKLVEK